MAEGGSSSGGGRRRNWRDNMRIDFSDVSSREDEEIPRLKLVDPEMEEQKQKNLLRWKTINYYSMVEELEHLFLNNNTNAFEDFCSRAARENHSIPTDAEFASTWKSGKATEVFERYGYLQHKPQEEETQLPKDESHNSNPNPMPNALHSYMKLPVTTLSNILVTNSSKTITNSCTTKPSTSAAVKADQYKPGPGLNTFNFKRRFSPPRVLPPKPSGSTQAIPGNSTRFANATGPSSAKRPQLFSSFGGASSTCAVPNSPIVGQAKSVPLLSPVTQWRKPEQSAVNANKALTDGQEGLRPEGFFKSAYEVLAISDKAKGIKRPFPPPPVHFPGLRKNPRLDNTGDSKPEKKSEDDSDNPEVNELMKDERLKNIEAKMVEAILNEVVEVGGSTGWDDIAGLRGVKDIIREIIIWPMQRPDIFTGLRGPPKGILLFGPPGTGKTMIGRLIATQSESTFFNISASSLTSKWIGDGEKMVRALFQVARVKQPAVIFIDEIDSILTQRSDTEHESSRRLKTEFLIQFDGCGTKTEDRILVIGVTNRPQELDEAARRRLVKRIYIPLPDIDGRKQLVKNLVRDQHVSLTEDDYDKIAEISDGYSGADMASLCKEAAYGPIRDIGHDIQNIQADKVRPMLLKDFQTALRHVKASVATNDLGLYAEWDNQFGCHI